MNERLHEGLRLSFLESFFSSEEVLDYRPERFILLSSSCWGATAVQESIRGHDKSGP
mgnify:CR=1 FL=1